MKKTGRSKAVAYSQF